MSQASAAVPVVSVLTTAFNRANHVGAAIESVLASSFANLELIVVDDASADDTFDIARFHAAADDRVRVFKNDRNLGDYVNRNRAAALARGRYLKYLDSDDHLYPYALEYLVALMDAHPSAGYALSQKELLDRPHPLVLSPRAAYLINFFHANLFGRAPNSAFIRTEAFRQVGGFSGKRHVGDHELWLTLSRHYPLLTTPPALAWDRTHAGQEKSLNREMKQAMHLAIQRDALAHPDCPLTPEERRMALENVLHAYGIRVLKTAFRHGDLHSALTLQSHLQLPWHVLLKAPFRAPHRPPIPQSLV
ncbi:MAG: glycosyltransferase family 2 protein [Magnetococcales bacterium]|nr:glycosyltransferase family 2 protein [Magnetococcales bacterium]